MYIFSPVRIIYILYINKIKDNAIFEEKTKQTKAFHQVRGEQNNSLKAGQNPLLCTGKCLERIK